MTPSVVAEGLSKRYILGKGKAFGVPTLGSRASRKEREIWALRDASFSVEPGTVLGVIGRNGAGKTTLLKVLARITLPTEGKAVVRGRTVSLLELGAGFQKDSTARESIYLNAALHGISNEVVNRRFDEIVAFAELERFIDTPLKRFSSGMYLRLAFAVAVNLEPDLLLADEVLAVGDIAFQERCLRRVESQAADDGLAVLFVSHDMSAIRRLCHQVLWLDRGRVVAVGPPDEVVSSYENAIWDMMSSEAPHDSQRARDERAEIIDVTLRSESGEELGAARVDEDIYVEVAARIHAPAELRYVLAFFVQGAPAFRTAQPHEAVIQEPGIYVGRVRIPAHLLADTTYSVKAGVQLDALDGSGFTSLVLDDALTFRVYDTDEDSSARGTYRASLVGVVRPRLDWTCRPGDLALSKGVRGSEFLENP